MKDQIKDWCVCNRTNSVIFVCFCFVFVVFFFKMSLFAKNERFFAVSSTAVYSLSEITMLSVLCMSCSESLLETKKKSEQNLFWGSDS